MPKRGVKMPRCRKRIVCKEPDVKVFIHQQNDNSEMLIMTVDEYESIRLIDLEGFIPGAKVMTMKVMEEIRYSK